jgi:hypothetical protein
MRYHGFSLILALVAVLVCFTGFLTMDASAQDGCQLPGPCGPMQGQCGPMGCEEGCAAPWLEQEPCAGNEACVIPNLCGPRWSIAAEALVLQRTSTRGRTLFDQPNTTDTDRFNARDFNFPVALGYQLSAIRHDILGCDWEVGYFQVDGFAAESFVPGVSRMVTDVNGIGFTVNDALAQYDSAIYSGEFNMRRKWSEAFTFLAGYRMLQLNEHYLGSGVDVVSPTIADSLAASTYNHLYGFQLGADIGVYDMGGPLTVNVLCKAGVFNNYAHHAYNLTTVDNGIVTGDVNSGAGRNQAAFLGQATAVATYALTKHLAFRASAEAIWLTGVALAPEQIGAVNLRTNQYGINTSGALFYYGGGMGLEYRF